MCGNLSSILKDLERLSGFVTTTVTFIYPTFFFKVNSLKGFQNKSGWATIKHQDCKI